MFYVGKKIKAVVLFHCIHIFVDSTLSFHRKKQLRECMPIIEILGRHAIKCLILRNKL